MGEVIVASSAGAGGYAPTELHMHRALAGDIETVRARLIAALESLQYTVISEEPLQAYRAERGWAAALMSNDVLEYGIKLTVALKQVTPGVVRATFSYAVGHPWLTKGDHRTVAREADAVVALASVRARETTCQACGADAVGDSRYCRACGAPLAGGALSELEVLRLTEGARSAHQTIVTAVIIFLCALPMLLISLLGTKPSAVTVGLVIFSLLAVSALITLIFGIRRLHRTLNSAEPQPTAQLGSVEAVARPASLNAHARPAELPARAPQPAPFSITEGTTELLYAERVERAPTTDKTLGERRDDLTA